MDEQVARVWIAAFGVLGTLLGAILGFLGSYLLERGRRSREDQHRFSAERRELYVRIMTGSDLIHNSATIKALNLRMEGRAVVPGPEMPDFDDAVGDGHGGVSALHFRNVDTSSAIWSWRSSAAGN